MLKPSPLFISDFQRNFWDLVGDHSIANIWPEPDQRLWACDLSLRAATSGFLQADYRNRLSLKKWETQAPVTAMWDCVLEFTQKEKGKGWWKTSPLLLGWPGCLFGLYLMEQSVWCYCKHQWKQQVWKIFSNDRRAKLILQLKSLWLLWCKHQFFSFYCFEYLVSHCVFDEQGRIGIFEQETAPAWMVEQSGLAEHNFLSCEIRCTNPQAPRVLCILPAESAISSEISHVSDPPGWLDLISLFTATERRITLKLENGLGWKGT